MIDLRYKIGQMLIIGFSGYEIDQHSPVVRWLQEDSLGSVLLFDFDLPNKCYGKNLKSREQIKRLTSQLHHYANVTAGPSLYPHGLTSGSKDLEESEQLPAELALADENRLPLFIALDYEGGAVDRLKKIDGCMTTIKASEQALLSDEELYLEAARMAETVQDLGFNLNFAPVVDLNLNAQQGIIGKLGRSFSVNPQEVVRAARQVVRAFGDYGVVCSYKHFPGHGSASGDTHQGFVDVTESYHASELKPYETLLSDVALPSAMVMTAHVINRQLDASGLPATLSRPIITDLLRKKMGFDGVVVSDDLQMQAISNHYSIDEALRLTINAGADMVIFANQLGDITATDVVDRIERLVKSGAIELSRIEESFQRISRLKKEQIKTVRPTSSYDKKDVVSSY